MITYFFRTFPKINTTYTNVAMCIVGIITYFWLYFKYSDVRRNSKFIFLFIFFATIATFMTNNSNIGNIVVILTNQAIAFVLVKDKSQLKYFHWFLYLICTYMFFVYMIEHKFDNILNRSSSNFVSVILIAFLIMSSIYLISINRKPSMLLMVIGVGMCVLAGGRGGILSILCLCVGILFLNEVSSKSKPIKFLFFLTVGICFFAIYYIYYDKIVYYLGIVTYDAPRFYIWNLYLTETFNSVRNILVGTPLITHQIFVNFSYNLHNIFFNLHAKFGIFPLILVIYGNIKCFIYYIKTKNYYYLLFLGILLLRSFTDFTSFPGVFDIPWFYLLYDCIINNKKSIEN